MRLRAATLLIGFTVVTAACGGGSSRPAEVAEAPPLPAMDAATEFSTATTDPSDPVEVAPVEPESETAPEADAPAAPRMTAAERRALEIDAALADAGVARAAPGQLTIVLDPGHGGPDTGGAGHGVAEPSSNLDLALRVEEILVARGYHVVLTRRDDGASVLTSLQRASTTLRSWRSTRPDRHARTELAAHLDADVFVSIHSNAHPDPGVRGVEAWYHPTPGLSELNQRLGTLIIGHVLFELDAYGYDAPWLGLRDDTCWRQFGSVCRSLYVLSPPLSLTRERLEQLGVAPQSAGFRESQDTIYTRGNAMPSVLMELLFMSSEADAAILRDGAGRQAIARGVAQGIIAYLDESAEVRAGGEG